MQKYIIIDTGKRKSCEVNRVNITGIHSVTTKTITNSYEKEYSKRSATVLAN